MLGLDEHRALIEAKRGSRYGRVRREAERAVGVGERTARHGAE